MSGVDQAGGPMMVDAIPDERGPAEPADTLAPPVPEVAPETTDAGPVSSARDSAAGRANPISRGITDIILVM